MGVGIVPGIGIADLHSSLQRMQSRESSAEPAGAVAPSGPPSLWSAEMLAVFVRAEGMPECADAIHVAGLTGAQLLEAAGAEENQLLKDLGLKLLQRKRLSRLIGDLRSRNSSA